MANTLLYYADKRPILKGTLGSLAFLVVGIWLLTTQSPRDTVLKDALLLLFGVVPWAMFVLLGIAILLRRSPLITISDSGIRWRAVLARGDVTWSEITQAKCVNYQGAWFINLGVVDEDRFIAQQPFLHRTLCHFLKNVRWPVNPAYLPGSGVKDVSAGQIAKQIRRRIDASNNSFKPKPLRGAA